MTTILIDEKTTKGKKLLDFIREYAGDEIVLVKSSRISEKIIKTKEPSAGLSKSIREAKDGKVTRHKSAAALMAHLKGQANV